MAKSSGGQSGMFLKLSGIIFCLQGLYHLYRYFFGYEPRLLELTYLGSLWAGAGLFIFGILCLKASK